MKTISIFFNDNWVTWRCSKNLLLNLDAWSIGIEKWRGSSSGICNMLDMNNKYSRVISFFYCFESSLFHVVSIPQREGTIWKVVILNINQKKSFFCRFSGHHVRYVQRYEKKSSKYRLGTVPQLNSVIILLKRSYYSKGLQALRE